MKNSYKYKISVVIPVYKVEKYIEETIKSVMAQTIGFKNIQLILINDGSPDNSEEICLRYKEKYPNNVCYIKQENSGVSATRNNGIKHIEGKYVHFLDSDDKLTKNVYKTAYDMLEKNSKVDSCVLRIKMFGKASKKHYLDFRFNKGSRVVDLRKEYIIPVFSIWSLVTRSEIVKKYEFDTRLKIGEDFKFVADILSSNPVTYLMADAYYLYRVRENESSVMQSSNSRKDNYIEIVKYCYKYILELSRKFKDTHNWLQSSVITNMSFRLCDINLSCLNDKEKEEYVKDLRELYSMCDDNLLIEAFTTITNYKFRALEFKYKRPIAKDIKVKDQDILLKNKIICKVKDLETKINVFEIKGNKLNISAVFEPFLNNDFDMYIKADNKYYKFRKINKNETTNNIYSKDYSYYKSVYDIDFDLKGINSFELYIKINGEYVLIKPTYQNLTKINELPHSYYKRNGFTITHKGSKFFVNKKTHFKFLKYLKDVLLIKKDILVFGMLIIYKLTYPFVRHDNWIISDRFDVAGDNGEWMFKYIKANTKKRNVYFALGKKSKDNSIMKSIGKVIHFNTVSYFIKYMNAEVVVSSHIDDFIRRPFGKKQMYLGAFMPYRYVFLQHGCTKSDMSNWLYKCNKNIDLLICSANMEYNEFLNDRYIYNKDIVKLTGMPRFDNLYNTEGDEENLITFMPTWRSTLCGPIIPRSQNREYNPNFKNSEYYKFYNGIITDKSFIDCLKKNKCKVLFCVHPAFVNQLCDFENTDYVTFKTEVYYPEVFKRAKLMLTDYSSVAFDFGYTKKPLIYTQFDKDHLFQIHTVITDDGEFSYEEDGFGPVTYDLESTIKLLIKTIDGGFKNDKKYIDRVNRFFKYQDNKNCQRVYDEIIKMIERTK